MREILAVLMFFCILPFRQVEAAPLYSLTAPLGSLGGGYTAGTDLNNKGQATGTSSLVGATQNAFFYDGTFLQDLGTLGGSGSIGLGLNNRGWVAGTSEVLEQSPFGQQLFHAFLWTGGPLQDLGTLGGGSSGATDVNDRGQVVGASQTGSGIFRATLWDGGDKRELATLGGVWSGAAAINERGQIVGTSEDASGIPRAFLWEDGRIQDLGTPSSEVRSSAIDINEAGQIVGESEPEDFVRRAFLWEDDQITYLTGPEGTSGASAINDRGQVGGYSNGAAFLWDPSFGLMSLDDIVDKEDFADYPNVNFVDVAGLNDRGQILALGSYTGPNGEFLVTSFLLSPEPAVVPEPGTLTLILGGLLALACAARIAGPGSQRDDMDDPRIGPRLFIHVIDRNRRLAIPKP